MSFAFWPISPLYSRTLFQRLSGHKKTDRQTTDSEATVFKQMRINLPERVVCPRKQECPVLVEEAITQEDEKKIKRKRKDRVRICAD